ncbi:MULTISPECIES: hypothetical protein [Lysobacter]|uniref:hypothetical protein n=1 Tax=Lysobacter TaxID=68 RepID=UPI001F421BFF|nr:MULTISPECIES: hypothetical protein [Lysobacter]UJB21582.1 hypothetical protein L1A79_11250 [Lysobacter capsici]UJQ29301.1 hypothetical protein L2D09_03615 [Lysobacter gummosus]
MLLLLLESSLSSMTADTSKSKSPLAPLFQRVELFRRDVKTARPAVAPFEKGGGVREADAGDLLLILLLPLLEQTPPQHADALPTGRQQKSRWLFD